MKPVTFDSVPVNTEFVYKGTSYIKEEKAKISCCRFTNARSVANPGTKIGLTAKTVVEVQD